MKKQDFIFIIVLAAFFVPFILSKEAFDFLFNKETGMNSVFPLTTAFVKFFFLATLGELLGLRIKTGSYFKKGFGIFPHAVVWGFLGIFIAMAFITFYSGSLGFVAKIFGMENGQEIMSGALSWNKLLIAFVISTLLNVMFAPVFMTMHKITDIHIQTNGGKFRSLITPIKVEKIITSMDWKTQWSFIFKKTIPLFWIPAQTINFLFPEEFRVLNAAILGIVLGVILSIANIKSEKQA
ncbi:MAG: Mpv17/PMP22 family protein [Bacteroidales bacterium]|nr:Mpv17/PMP22 family protein [Bacteroidales bacterium]